MCDIKVSNIIITIIIKQENMYMSYLDVHMNMRNVKREKHRNSIAIVFFRPSDSMSKKVITSPQIQRRETQT